MQTLDILGRVLPSWHEARAPLLAAAAAGGALLLGRLLRAKLLQGAAVGLGLSAGWIAAAGGVPVAPHSSADRLPVLALTALALGLAADVAGRPWVAWLARLALALACGWWLAGAPASDAQAGAVLPLMACIALAVLLAAHILAEPRSQWLAPAAALAFWGALAAVGAAPAWRWVALVPLAASLGQLAEPRGLAALRLPLAAGLAGVTALAVAAMGRMPHGGFGRFDLAALAPLLAAWAVPRLLPRLPWGGGFAAALAAAALAVGLVWSGVRAGLVR
jgi:hypothetical protein